jgi:hypothetical protein
VKARGVPGQYLIRHWDLTVETYGDDEYYREKIRSSAATRNCTNSTCFWARPAETYKRNWKRVAKRRGATSGMRSQFSKVKETLPASTSTKRKA